MKFWFPLILLGVFATAALVSAVRRSPEVPDPSASKPALPVVVKPRTLPPPDDGRPLPPLEELIQAAQKKSVPPPPPLATATPEELDTYSDQLDKLMSDSDREIAALARDIKIRMYRDRQDKQRAAKKKESEERRKLRAAEREARLKARREEHPIRPVDPSRPVRPPLIDPPVLPPPVREEPD